MLGMDSTSSRRYFIQTRIITENKSKINPFLKKIWTGTDFFFRFPVSPLVKSFIFHKKFICGKMPIPPKSQKSLRIPENIM